MCVLSAGFENDEHHKLTKEVIKDSGQEEPRIEMFRRREKEARL